MVTKLQLSQASADYPSSQMSSSQPPCSSPLPVTAYVGLGPGPDAL